MAVICAPFQFDGLMCMADKNKQSKYAYKMLEDISTAFEKRCGKNATSQMSTDGLHSHTK
eukprot:4722849-Amphidinium_carterae.1